jgi:hypothetical protein
MNKDGGVVIYGVMLGLVIVVLALALAPVVMNSTNRARNATIGDTIGMDCNNASISDFDKAACTATDLTLFYFIGGLIFIAGTVITAKIIFG